MKLGLWIILLLLAVFAVGGTAYAQVSTLADKMKRLGLIELSSLDSSFIIDLRYATSNNFAGKNMYGKFKQAFLVKDAARSLLKAQKALQRIDVRYSIIIYDAARPRTAQQAMWDAVKGTVGEQYVAPPGKGGPHNFGVAVDVGLAFDGVPLDMGTEFDSFNTASHITDEEALVAEKKISPEALKNRRLLRKAMTDAGFLTYRREWWHFERYRVKYARANYKLLDF